MRHMLLLSDRKSQIRLVCVLVVLFALLGLWVLNLLHVVGGSWSLSLNAIFTSLGSIAAFLQWHMQAMSATPNAAEWSSHEKANPHEQLILGQVTRRKGAITVYAPRTWRGTTLYLRSGLQDASGPFEAASNVVERRIAGQYQFSGHFPAVLPGHYTLMAPSRKRQAQITVYPGHLAEVDWR